MALGLTDTGRLCPEPHIAPANVGSAVPSKPALHAAGRGPPRPACRTMAVLSRLAPFCSTCQDVLAPATLSSGPPGTAPHTRSHPGLGIRQLGKVQMPRAPKIVQMSQCTGSPGNPAHLTPCLAYTPLLLPDSYWLNLSPGQPSTAPPIASSHSELGGLSSAFHLSQGQDAVARHQKTLYIL